MYTWIIKALTLTVVGCWLSAIGSFLLLSSMCSVVFRAARNETDETHLLMARIVYTVVIFIYSVWFIASASRLMGMISFS